MLRKPIYWCQHFRPPPCVVLPLKNDLVIDKFGTLRTHNFTSKMFVLEQVKEVETDWVLEIFCIVRLFPVQQIFQVVEKAGIFEEATLRQNWNKHLKTN